MNLTEQPWLAACGLWLRGNIFVSCSCPWQTCALWNSSLSRPCCGWAGKSLLMDCGPWQAALDFSLLLPPTYENGKGRERQRDTDKLLSVYMLVLFDPGVLPPGFGPSLLIYRIPWRNGVHTSHHRWATIVKSRTNIYIYVNREGGGPQLPLISCREISSVKIFLPDEKKRVRLAFLQDYTLEIIEWVEAEN